jgi:hypothetical protein
MSSSNPPSGNDGEECKLPIIVTESGRGYVFNGVIDHAILSRLPRVLEELIERQPYDYRGDWKIVEQEDMAPSSYNNCRVSGRLGIERFYPSSPGRTPDTTLRALLRSEQRGVTESHPSESSEFDETRQHINSRLTHLLVLGHVQGVVVTLPKDFICTSIPFYHEFKSTRSCRWIITFNQFKTELLLVVTHKQDRGTRKTKMQLSSHVQRRDSSGMDLTCTRCCEQLSLVLGMSHVVTRTCLSCYAAL